MKDTSKITTKKLLDMINKVADDIYNDIKRGPAQIPIILGVSEIKYHKKNFEEKKYDNQKWILTSSGSIPREELRKFVCNL